MDEVVFGIKSQAADGGNTEFGGKLKDFAMQALFAIDGTDRMAPMRTCEAATASLRARATAALFLLRRMARAKLQLRGGFSTCNRLLAACPSSARMGPRP
ncbi:MAG: hypothetical protein WBV90_22150 [Terrimicrobiaceae bacterium]